MKLALRLTSELLKETIEVVHDYFEDLKKAHFWKGIGNLEKH